MAWLYKRALDESIGLSSLLVMVLLHDDARKSQLTGLIDFVKNNPARDAHELGLNLHNAMCDLAAKQNKQGMASGVAGYLWKLKQEGGVGPKATPTT